jgi:flagellar hook-length control protein FliK
VISPPIQSIENLEAPKAASFSPGHSAAEKKKGPGVFARLLAGMLQKIGKPDAGLASGTEMPEESGAVLKSGRSRASRFGADGDAGEIFPDMGHPHPGKNHKVSFLKGGDPGEGLEKADALYKKEKARPGARTLRTLKDETNIAAETGLDVGSSWAKRTLAANQDAGDEAEAPARVRLRDPVQAAGEPGSGEIPDTAVEEASVRLAPEEKARTDRSGLARGLETDLSGGELSPDMAEGLAAGTAGQNRNVRSPDRATAGKDGRNPVEVRSRDRRKERLNPEAGEFRVEPDKQGVQVAGNIRTEAGKEDEASSGKGRDTERSSTELTVELRSLGKTQSEISLERENRPVQSFQNMLARELHENLNGDIVRHASVMLRDGGEGTIRLSLRPETLGSVKIRLEITENKIMGRITVESDEAFKAFEQELHSLEESFLDSGFDGANLEMAFFSEGGQEGRRGREGDSLFSGRFAASSYDAAVSVTSESPEAGQWLGIRLDNQGRPLVNMLI